MKDFYEILGVSKDADRDAIRKAYRELAKEAHPDRGGSDDKFRELQQAYSVLQDHDKRSAYDRGELDEVLGVQDRAKKNLFKVADSIISSGFFDPESRNLIDAIRSEINERVLTMDSDVEDIEIEIRKLDDVKLRLDFKLLEESIDNTILLKRTSIRHIESEIETSNMMLELLEDASYTTGDLNLKELEYDEE